MSPDSQNLPPSVTVSFSLSPHSFAISAKYSAPYIEGLALSAIPPSIATYFVPFGTCFELDGGMSDNPRPSMYQAEYVAEVAGVQAEEKEVVTLAGRFCESGDIIIEDIELPKLKAGDIICVYNTGAYNYSMASNYNRVPRPEVLMVKDGNVRTVIKRETYEDIVSRDI